MFKLINSKEEELLIEPFSEKRIGHDTRYAFVIQCFGDNCNYRAIAPNAKINLNGKQTQGSKLNSGDTIKAGEEEYKFIIEAKKRKTVVHQKKRRAAPKVANAPSIDPNAYAGDLGPAPRIRRKLKLGRRAIPLIIALAMMIYAATIIMKSTGSDLTDAIDFTQEIVGKIGAEKPDTEP